MPAVGVATSGTALGVGTGLSAGTGTGPACKILIIMSVCSVLLVDLCKFCSSNFEANLTNSSRTVESSLQKMVGDSAPQCAVAQHARQQKGRPDLSESLYEAPAGGVT